MKKQDHNSLISLPLVIFIALGIAYAGSQASFKIYGIPLFALTVGLAFIIQWLVFIPSYLLQTEKLFDLTGSFTYISVTLLAVIFGPKADCRSLIILLLVVIWAIRLGNFLFRRVRRVGKDGRFDEIKPYFIRYLNTWTLQGLWVSLTLSAALVVITTNYRRQLSWFALIGFLIWVFGFTFEAIADAQKNRFRKNPNNQGKFIKTGLWARSRHPNYFGEIVLWTGIAVIALPVLRGWQWVALISPVFVAFLLTQISGIPILEKRADQKWGDKKDYQIYKKNTPVLIPKL